MGIESTIVEMLESVSRHSASIRNGRKVVTYNLGIKLLALLLGVPISGALIYGTFQSAPDDRIFVGAIAGLLTLGVLYMICMVFLTKLEFDDNYVHIASPLRRSGSFPWSALTEGGYSASMMMYFVRGKAVGRIWVSPMQHGWAEFLRTAGSKMQALRLDDPFTNVPDPRGV